MSLWQADYLELKTIKAQKTKTNKQQQKNTFDLSPNHLKEFS